MLDTNAYTDDDSKQLSRYGPAMYNQEQYYNVHNVKQHHNRLHLHGITDGRNRHPLGHSSPCNSSCWHGLLTVELGYEEPQAQLERQLETGHHLLHLLPNLVSYVHVLYVVTVVMGKGNPL